MATLVGRVYPLEIRLLKKEIEVQGDLLNHERLERKAEIDHIRLELNALKRLFEQIHPGFQKRFGKVYDQAKHTWNPELERKEIPPPLKTTEASTRRLRTKASEGPMRRLRSKTREAPIRNLRTSKSRTSKAKHG